MLTAFGWPDHDEDRASFFDSGQVVEVRRLAKLDWIVLSFGGEQHGDAIRDLLEQLRPPRDKLSLIERLLCYSCGRECEQKYGGNKNVAQVYKMEFSHEVGPFFSNQTAGAGIFIANA
jgi:hypothetical protein